jgi:hypothetical protein
MESPKTKTNRMRAVLINCPRTGLPIPTGIATGEHADLRSQYLKNAVDCPRCGERHFWSGADAFFED